LGLSNKGVGKMFLWSFFQVKEMKITSKRTRILQVELCEELKATPVNNFLLVTSLGWDVYTWRWYLGYCGEAVSGFSAMNS
jgi:hypothetical protein